MVKREPPSAPPPDERHDSLLTARQVAKVLNVSVRTVRRLGLPVVVLGPRMHRYLEHDVQQWLRRKRGELAGFLLGLLSTASFFT